MNESIGEDFTTQVFKLMRKKGIFVIVASLLLLGITLKENFADVWNTKIVDVTTVIVDCGIKVTIYDSWANLA
jgi:UDP-N-acetyl-D-galactosamine dehydrogenase